MDFSEWADPAARPDFAKAVETVRSLGVQMEETKLPDFPYGPTIGTIISSEASAIFEPLIQSGDVNQLADQKQIAGLKAGLEIPAKDYLKAMRIRSLMQEAIRTLFDEYRRVARALAPRTRAENHAAAGSSVERPADAEGARAYGSDPGREFGGSSGIVAPVRIRRWNADCDSTGGPAVFGEFAADHRKVFSGTHGLA